MQLIHRSQEKYSSCVDISNRKKYIKQNSDCTFETLKYSQILIQYYTSENEGNSKNQTSNKACDYLLYGLLLPAIRKRKARQSIQLVLARIKPLLRIMKRTTSN